MRSLGRVNSCSHWHIRVAHSAPVSDHVSVTGELRVLSVYEGFFTGGARILHSGVIAALHGRGRQLHSVLSIHEEMRRESLRQKMSKDASCRLLRGAGLEVSTLGRTPSSPDLRSTVRGPRYW